MDERQQKLQEYILLCIRDSAITWADLTSPNAIEKVMKTLTRDVTGVLKNLGRLGGAELLRMAVTKFMSPKKG